MHYQMKLPYRKIRLLFRDLFHLDFTPGAVPGFYRQVSCRGSPIYENMFESLPAQRYVHADETNWRNEGVNHWLWCFIAPGYMCDIT